MTLRHPSGAAERRNLRHVRLVRITLTIDDDVLEAARCIADDEHVSLDEILSRLARRGLEPRPDEPAWARLPPPTALRPASRRRSDDAWDRW